ncbi:hypothetical protein WL58_17980 [Burkholderia cepacia]|uniref:hypothetical protein n=1 Tax=Burkholderia cepacia TaxID=292 RepID=UPI00075330A6|nr:hypothetical protein [Burkholderia cepacia]KWC82760.1 hypothetical protein WL58_17980 [Burkholderia cepacia]
MTAKRESYVRALVALMEGDAELQAQGVVVERSIFDAISREEGRVLVISRGRDVVVDDNIARVTRRCELLLSAVIRASAPDAAADEIFERTHPIVKSFAADDLLGIVEVESDEPRTASSEGGIGVLTMKYTFEYQTATNAL